MVGGVLRSMVLYVVGAACAGAFLAAGLTGGSGRDLVIGLVVLAAVAVCSPVGLRPLSRLVPQHTSPETIAAAPVVIFWRPWCPYCQRLRGRLGPAGRGALWVNIWRDRDAAARVRQINEGNETVPTVLIGGEPHTNPDPDLVRRALTRRENTFG